MILTYLFMFLLLSCEVSAKRRLKANESENSARYNFRQPSRMCGTTKMDVHLIELSSFFSARANQGFLDVSLPSSPRRPLLVCFPPYFRQYRQAYLLGHAACRQMGYAAATAVQGKRVPAKNFRVAVDEDEDVQVTTRASLPLPKGLSPVSWNCAGHEQNIAQCAWYTIRVEGCHMLTELTCGECQNSLKGLSGFIKTPGYPVTHYFDMMCDWKIEVPEEHSISLVFNYLNPLLTEQSEFDCVNDKPYVEIIYGDQGSFHIRRHCNFRMLKNVTVPHHKVQIRFFSGLYNPRGLHILDKEQGLAVAFKALPNEAHSFIIDTIIIATVCSTCFVALIYLFRKTICFRLTYDRGATMPVEELPSNVPGRVELERAYEFQRCQVQPHVPKGGLRLRSNGSRNKTTNVRVQDSFTDRLCTTFRKFSSNSYTPRTIIPASLKSDLPKDAKFQTISNLKANLLDRYSRSSRKESCSSVFLPVPGPAFNFPIYHSVSSESQQDVKKNPSLKNRSSLEDVWIPPPQETAI